MRRTKIIQTQSRLIAVQNRRKRRIRRRIRTKATRMRKRRRLLS